MKIGDRLPNFNVTATQLPSLSSNDLLGRYTIFYFYPKDNTPGCTNEGLDFAERYADFQKMDADIFGISRDSLKKHENFKAKYNFPFELISDPDETLCELFDVIKLKKNYGREYLGIERSTFLLNPENELTHEWRKVRVKDHVNEVMTTLQTLQND